MTFRAAFRRYLTELLNDAPAPADRPTPNQESTIPTTTPSTNGTPPSELTTLANLMTTTLASLERMQANHEREMRETVISILQGRPMDQSAMTPPDPEAVAAQMELLPPNYDDDSMPLPGGIQSVLAREEDESEQMRQLLTERGRLEAQLAEAESRLLSDPQGPTNGSTPS